jgi:hypothetical protein
MQLKGYAMGLSMAAFFAFSPMLVSQAQAQDCVRTVRSISDFTIQGDGWTWWKHSVGYYERDNRPSLGSVLVFKRASHMRRGHVSLVSAVIDRRTIEVDHSWLDGHGLRRGMRVVDVSPRNDWSQVRVWHEPTAQLGQSVYPTYGFVLPQGETPRGRLIEVADKNGAAQDGQDQPRRTFSVAPTGRGGKHDASQQRPIEALVGRAGGRNWVVPGNKPTIVNASLPVDKAASVKGQPTRGKANAVSVAPRRKPAGVKPVTTTAAKPQAGKRELVSSLAKPLPAHKPADRDVAELPGAE